MAFVVAVAILAMVILASPVVAQDSDTTAPTLSEGERGNATTIVITITDDTDVDEGSIDAADFDLSDGDVRAVQANDSGTDARVELYLEDRLNTDRVTVELASDANVSDAAGNRLTNGSVTVTGMDSYLPKLREFQVDRVNDSAGRIVVRASEPLDGLEVKIRGPTSANLTRDDFRALDDNTFGIPHVTTYRFPEDGVYTVSLTVLEDEAGHFVNYSRDRTFVRDASTPTAALSGPKHLESEDVGRFDGSDSTDNVGVVGYEWRVDGEPVDGEQDGGSASTLAYAFDEPGTHEVGLTVADDGGNEGTANWSVVVHEATSKRGVTVTTTNATGRQFDVGTDRVNERVRIADRYGRLAGGDDVTLRSLLVTLPTNQTLRLNVSGNGTVSSFESTTGSDALTAATIAHGNQSVEDPTFRFSVSAARLSQAGISYSDVALYRDDGNWTELPTEVVRATKSTVVYEAASPGLSTFVVGASGAEGDWESADKEATPTDDAEGEDGSDADVSVTGAALVSESVEFGQYAVVEATLANEGDGDGTFVAGVAVGPDVVDARPVAVASGETRQISFAIRAVSNGTVTVNGTIAGELRVVDGPETPTGQAPDGEQSNSSDEEGDDGFEIPIPNPLTLWPDGLAGTILTGVIGFVVVGYGLLKGMALYLGY